MAGRRVEHNSAAMVPAGCGELAERALLAGDHASGGAMEAGRERVRRGGGGAEKKARRGGAAQWRWRGEVEVAG